MKSPTVRRISRRLARFPKIIAAVVLPLLLSCAGNRADRPNVLLITFDTLRADHLHCYGYERIRTPVIDSLAANGTLFENAYTAIPITLPSHTSILTGLYPNQHGVRDNGVYRLADKTVTTAEILRDAGYETAAFVGAHVLDRSYRIDQGFDLYDDEMEEALVTDNPIGPDGKVPEYTRRWVASWTQPYQRKAEAVAERALQWLRDREGGKPFYCWVHFFDPHTSYAPPVPWADLYGDPYEGPADGTAETYRKITRGTDDAEHRRHYERMIALYDGEISYADHWLGKLLDEIPENTLILFLSDHGEAFGEHGQLFEHGGSIFSETVHIPLIVAGPGVERGVRRHDIVSSVDVLPTILDRLHLKRDSRLPGRSLLGTDDGDDERAIYSETMCSRTAVPSPTSFRGVRTADWSLIFRINKRDLSVAKTRLHHFAGNRDEMIDLHEKEPGKFAALREKYDAFVGLGGDDEKNPENFWDLSEEDERFERLRALGYVD